ncbi:SDR family oxidoreductase [Streptomyces sp. DH8]|uniref:SDR family oxidoreductase n=1 Tax=Streptomyces sp. DH8 TaxID=2857008 RepID=UPI001E2F68F5|nr:SDR family oxidoreductase [Streptomyces sp. DH8]
MVSASAGLLCHGAVKGAGVRLTKTRATTPGPHAIRVNTVAPRWIRTPMAHRHRAAGRHRAEPTRARGPPSDRPGEPEAVAHPVPRPAFTAPAFTTGRVLRPNGGVALPG